MNTHKSKYSIFYSPESISKPKKHLPGESFIAGGFGCVCAGFTTNPIDVAKIRMQLSGELGSSLPKGSQKSLNVFSMIPEIYKSEGIGGLFKGVRASMYREASYSTLRIGLYPFIKAKFSGKEGVNTKYGASGEPFWIQLTAGLTSGAIGSIVANPFDLIKVRMQADPAINPKDAKYQSFGAGFRDIYQNEGGFVGLWRGWKPNVFRAAILTATQVAVYDSTKGYLLSTPYFSDDIWCHASAAGLSGFWTSLTTATVDQVKTRVMNDSMSTTPKYSGSIDCLVKTFRAEGIRGLFKGFTAQWVRIGPHSFVSFLVGEKTLKACGYIAENIND